MKTKTVWVLWVTGRSKRERGEWMPEASALDCANTLRLTGATRICIAHCPELENRWYYKA